MKGAHNGGRIVQQKYPEVRLNGYGTKTYVDGILFPSKAQAWSWSRLRELGGDPIVESEVTWVETPFGTYYPDTMLRNSVLDIPAGVPLELKDGNGEWVWSRAAAWAVENGEVYLICREDLPRGRK